MVLMTVGLKFLALSTAANNPALAVVIFVGDKITLVPVALRMWDEVRPVVRRDFALRQIDNVVHFVFHQLPRRARYVVRRQTRRLKAYLAPAMAAIRVLVDPIRGVLRPLGLRLKELLQAWARAARTVLAAVFWWKGRRAGFWRAERTKPAQHEKKDQQKEDRKALIPVRRRYFSGSDSLPKRKVRRPRTIVASDTALTPDLEGPNFSSREPASRP